MRPQLYNIGPMQSCEAANTDDLIQSHLSRAVSASGYICFICTFGCGSQLLRVPTYNSTGAISVFVSCLRAQTDLISIEGSASPLHLLSLWFFAWTISADPLKTALLPVLQNVGNTEDWKLCFSSSRGATVNIWLKSIKIYYKCEKYEAEECKKVQKFSTSQK